MTIFIWVVIIIFLLIFLFIKFIPTSLMCPKCRVKHSAMNLNLKPEATIFVSGSAPIKRIGNINVNGLLCFQCENFSEYAIWAADMKGLPGVTIDKWRYLATYPLTKDLKNYLLSMAKANGIDSIIKKIERIEVFR